MLPDVNREPAEVLQVLVLPSVSGYVFIELRRPPLPVVLGGGAVGGATMPEAAVNEYGYPRSRERDVRSPGECANLNPKTKSALVELASKRNLGPGILRRHCA